MATKQPSSQVLTEGDIADLHGVANVLDSLLEHGSTDPGMIRFAGYFMLSLADRFEQKTRAESKASKSVQRKPRAGSSDLNDGSLF